MEVLNCKVHNQSLHPYQVEAHITQCNMPTQSKDGGHTGHLRMLYRLPGLIMKVFSAVHEEPTTPRLLNQQFIRRVNKSPQLYHHEQNPHTFTINNPNGKSLHSIPPFITTVSLYVTLSVS